MKLENYLLLSLFFASHLFVVACTRTSLSKADNLLNQLPILSNQSISPQGCLNLQALHATLKNHAASFPALSVTTDFNLVTEAGRAKELFLTNSALDVKEMQVSDVQILNSVEQTDCEKVSSKTASGEILTYRIMKADARSISLKLEKNENLDLIEYRRIGLNGKLHPLKYDIEIMDGTHLRTRVTYKSFDARCRTSQSIQATLQTDFFWAAVPDLLPSEVQISETFYNKFLSTLPYGPSPMPIGIPAGPIENPQDPQPLPVPQPIVTEPPVETPPPEAESPSDPEVGNPQEPGEMPSARPAGLIVPAVQAANGYVFIPISELVENSQKRMKEELIKCQ